MFGKKIEIIDVCACDVGRVGSCLGYGCWFFNCLGFMVLRNLFCFTLLAVPLSGALAQGRDLRVSNFQGQDLRQENLQEADLQGSNLKDAVLDGANLQRANLKVAYLQGASLRDANLQNASLQVAHLQEADLQGADLRGANLQASRLKGADFFGAKVDIIWRSHIEKQEVSNYDSIIWIQ